MRAPMLTLSRWPLRRKCLGTTVHFIDSTLRLRVVVGPLIGYVTDASGEAIERRVADHVIRPLLSEHCLVAAAVTDGEPAYRLAARNLCGATDTVKCLAHTIQLCVLTHGVYASEGGVRRFPEVVAAIQAATDVSATLKQSAPLRAVLERSMGAQYRAPLAFVLTRWTSLLKTVQRYLCLHAFVVQAVLDNRMDVQCVSEEQTRVRERAAR